MRPTACVLVVCLTAGLILCAESPASAQLWNANGEAFISEIEDIATNNSYGIRVLNGPGGSTTVDLMTACADFSSAMRAIVCPLGYADDLYLGIVQRNGGVTTGSDQAAYIAVAGLARCTFDGAASVSDYVQLSTTTEGNCTSVGTNYPTNGRRVLGFVTVDLGGAGVTTIQLFGTGVRAHGTAGLTNQGSTGTVVNTLAKLTGAPSTAIQLTTADTAGQAVGIVSANPGTFGSAQVSQSGIANCVFDGSTTAGHYVTVSPTVAGNCHDAGATLPTNGVSIIGRVLSTNGAGGTYPVLVQPMTGMGPALGVVTADVSVTNSATLVDATGLVLAISSSATEAHQFECQLYTVTTSTAADWKLGWTFPTSATIAWGANSAAATADYWGNDVGTTQLALKTQTETLTFGSASVTGGVLFRGLIMGGGTAGDVQLQFAQNTATGSVTSTIKKFSTCVFRKIAA